MLTQRLRHRVTVEVQTEVRSPVSGSVKIQWVPYWCDPQTRIQNWPAEVLTGPGREAIASGSKQSETDARITLRWFPGLLQSMRIKHDDLIYDITSIEKDRTGQREYRLRCVHGVSDGS